MSDKRLEKMGYELSHQAAWNGVDILKVAAFALTDANFHDEAEIIQQMIKALESSDDTPIYRLAIEDGE